MSKILSFITVFCLTLTFAFATEPSEKFSLEEDQISAEFDQLNKIEKYVEQSDVTLEELQAQNPDLVAGIDLSSNSADALASADLPGGIPAFWWGCVLAVLGVILVYVLTDQDKEQTKKALIGCLVFAGAWVVYYVVIVALIGRSFWF
jgi:cytochrome c biogenesis protein CcdA